MLLIWLYLLSRFGEFSATRIAYVQWCLKLATSNVLAFLMQSYIWQSLMDRRNIIEKGVYWNIVNGDSAKNLGGLGIGSFPKLECTGCRPSLG